MRNRMNWSGGFYYDILIFGGGAVEAYHEAVELLKK